MANEEMRELSKFVLDRTGWMLSTPELTKLYTKYLDESTRTIDMKKLVEDLRHAVLTQKGVSTLVAAEEDELFRRRQQQQQQLKETKKEKDFNDSPRSPPLQRPSSASSSNKSSAAGNPSETESGNYGSNALGSTAHNKKKKRSPMNYNQIIDLIARQIVQRINLQSGENKLKKAYLLISESRSPVITRGQLKIALQTRLGIFLKDLEVEEIFSRLDPMCNGTINIQQFINIILKNEREYVTLSLQVGEKVNNNNGLANKKEEIVSKLPESAPGTSVGSRPPSSAISKGSNSRNSETSGQWDDNNKATITYDKHVVGLHPPNAAFCRPYSIFEIEAFIWDRVFERSNLADNMIKTLIRLFSNGETHYRAADNCITLDQLRYTLWKRLKMNITEADLTKFFEKYSKHNEVIDMFDLIDGIIRSHGNSKPLIDDRNGADKHDKLRFSKAFLKSPNLEEFLIAVRIQLNDLVNRESRAPHYLLHHYDRMTVDQAKSFFLQKLNLNFSTFKKELVDEVLLEYTEDNLMDVKRIIMEAMNVKEDKVRSMKDTVGVFGSQTLANGTVLVDAMPSSLKKLSLTPQRIEEIIVHKCEERQKSDHPHATLFRLFRDNDSDSNTITRKGMKYVMHKFDILPTPQEFEAFFLKHDRGDGKIDVHQFLRHIMPPPNMDTNQLTPKDPSVVKQQQTLASAVEELTGKRRDISTLNGPAYTRVGTDFLKELQNPDSGAFESKSPDHDNRRSTLESPLLAKSPQSSRPATAPSPSFSRRKTEISHPSTGGNHPATPTSFGEEFYHGNFNIEKTQTACRPQSTMSRDNAEKKVLAESLIHAMRDLKTLQVSPSPPQSSHVDNTKKTSTSNGQRDTQESDDYKIMQSQHLMALAQAYAQSIDISNNQSPQIESTSPRRPTTAPPSRPALSKTMKQFNATDTGMKPVVTPDPKGTHSPRDTSPRSDRRFTDSGQKKHAFVNPYNNRLMKMYKYTSRQCATTQEEYGLFLKNLERAIKSRRNMYAKQDEELMLSGSM